MPPMELGIDPSRLFDPRYISRKLISLPNSDGMGPVKFFNTARLRNWREDRFPRNGDNVPDIEVYTLPFFSSG